MIMLKGGQKTMKKRKIDTSKNFMAYWGNNKKKLCRYPANTYYYETDTRLCYFKVGKSVVVCDIVTGLRVYSFDCTFDKLYDVLKDEVWQRYNDATKWKSYKKLVEEYNKLVERGEVDENIYKRD